MTRLHTHLTIFLMILLLGICLNPSRSLAVSLQEEIEIGRKADQDVMKAYKLYDNKQAQEEINEIGQKLVKGVIRPDIKYSFKVLRDDELNAFAIPGGFVYFTDRLWNVLRPDERIGVLGHEIIHVDRRHSIDAMIKSRDNRLLTAVALILLKANNDIATAADTLNTLHELKYSRGDERQADEFGMQLVKQAGYNPAGLLLALRKIMRFENEAGGAPPAIFSSHPPTKDRLSNLTNLLTKMGVAIPPENVGNVQYGNRIGEVSKVNSNSTLSLTLNTPVQDGQVIWVMREGWDARYENKTQVALARVVVVGDSGNRVFYSTLLPGAPAADLKVGAGVYAPPTPHVDNSVATLEMTYPPIKKGGLQSQVKLDRLQRLKFRTVVWDTIKNVPTVESTAQIVITDPNSPTGFLSGARADYAYANRTTGQLVKFNDPDQGKWVGAVASVGRSSEQVEVLPVRKLTLGKVYVVLEPAWETGDTFEARTIATAKATSVEGKIILDVTSFASGHKMAEIQPAYDVYEQ